MQVVISGSFRKHLDEILYLKSVFEAEGIIVLKPVDFDVIINSDNLNFVRFVGEENKSQECLQNEYDIAIEECDAHIIFNKDGYIGSSALRELCLGAGNNALSIIDNGKKKINKKYSQVYLLEPIDETLLGPEISFINALIRKGNVKVGLDKMYQDFGMNKNNLMKKGSVLMKELTIANMPKNMVFQFAGNSYVWKVDRTATRRGNYEGSLKEFTEVFIGRRDGSVICECSGKLETNPGVFGVNGLDANNCFRIFSYDDDCGYSFGQEMPLTLASSAIAHEVNNIEPRLNPRKTRSVVLKI